MNKWEKEVSESLLDSEEEALKELEKQYQNALNQIGQKIKLFQSDLDMLDAALNEDGLDSEARSLLLSQKRSKIYQKQFQEALQGQINGILDQMHGRNYSTIEQYLKTSYEDAYLGEMYNLAQQGIPVITPINQSAATHAILTDSKVVRGYYNRLGVDVDHLKDVISREVSRGIASSLPYADIARNINNASRSGLYNAQRIARTEGHRIQNTASRDAANEAVAHGADLVKVWDSTLDGKTRESHRMVDGEVRELDELFSNGLDRPGDPSGSAEEVINCRCKRIHKPRWDVDGGFVKMDNFTGELRIFESPEDYAQFKERYWSKENQSYMSYVQDLESKYETSNFETLLGNMSDQEYQHFKQLESANPMWKSESENQWGINYGEKALDVDFSYINSEGYRSKFEGITNNQVVNDSIYNCATQILEHRTGTNKEDLYIINAVDGSVISGIISERKTGGVNYTEEFINALENARSNNIPVISLHNHPQGTPPSPHDFKKAYDNGYASSVIVGNNGQVYIYETPRIRYEEEVYNQMDSDLGILFSGGTDVDRAARMIYDAYGMNYTILEGSDGFE